MQRESVLLRINDDCPDPELARRPHDTNGDLATIGNQKTTDPLRHGEIHFKMHVMKKRTKTVQTIANPRKGCLAHRKHPSLELRSGPRHPNIIASSRPWSSDPARHCAAHSMLRASPGWPSMATRSPHAASPWRAVSPFGA